MSLRGATALALPYANVYCSTDNIGGTSDANGVFKMELDKLIQPKHLKVSYIGYQSKELILDHSSIEIEVSLENAPFEFSEVTIIRKVPPVSVNLTDNALTMRRNTGNTLPGIIAGGDVMRNIQLLPGVDATNDFSANLNVRGSGSDANMVMLDGIKLYNVEHFYGIFSAINPGIVEELNFYKNNFPIQYSGITASVLEMKTLPLNKEGFKASVQADLMTVNALINLPLNEQMSIVLSGRASHQNISNSSFFKLLQANREQAAKIFDENLENFERPESLPLTPNFQFYDWFGKWNWSISDQTRLQFSYFRGYDQYDYDYTNTFSSVSERRFENTEQGREKTSWKNQGVGLGVTHQWSTQLNSTLNISRSSYKLASEKDFSFTQNYSFGPPQEERVRALSAFDLENNIAGARIDLKNEWLTRDSTQLTFGYTFSNDETQFRFINQTRNKGDTLGGTNNAAQHILYGEWRKITASKYRP